MPVSKRAGGAPACLKGYAAACEAACETMGAHAPMPPLAPTLRTRTPCSLHSFARTHARHLAPPSAPSTSRGRGRQARHLPAVRGVLRAGATCRAHHDHHGSTHARVLGAVQCAHRHAVQGGLGGFSLALPMA